ncbi:MAG: FGGY-family carbohydrate kinase, partial [Anaerolineae bacterium]
AYEAAGRLCTQTVVPTPIEAVGLRRGTQDPKALWQAATSALRTVMSNVWDAPIGGVCVASVGEAGVPLDAQGKPTHPIIAWYDDRTAPLVPWWQSRVDPQAIFATTGLVLGHTYTLLKLQWLFQQAPDAWERTRRWLSVSDYLGYRLTGEQAIGYSLASRTMALDLHTLSWSDDLLAAAGVPNALLPDLAPEGTLLGKVHRRAALATGLPVGTPVVVGGHDHPVGALALGAIAPGIVLDSTGTTETELMGLPSVEGILQRDDRRFSVGCHAAPGSFYIKGAILGAGSLIRWTGQLLFPDLPDDARLQAMEDAAASAPPGARGVYVLPHFAGAGSPNRDSTARGVIAGLTTRHTRAEIARAAWEGLAYELRALWEALEDSSGAGIVRIVAAGGGSRSAFWNQLKANVTGRAISVSEQTEAVTLGAAMLAGLGTGVYANLDEAHQAFPLRAKRFEPEPRLAVTYDDLYRDNIESIRLDSVRLGALAGSLWQAHAAMDGDAPTP